MRRSSIWKRKVFFIESAQFLLQNRSFQSPGYTND